MDLRQPRVLVVDDTRLDREMARDALSEIARVECCASAEEALAALRREPADIVLSDLQMPGLSGLDLLQRLRREHPGTDFLLLTAHASVDSAIEALRMGAGDYLQKPIRPEELAHVFQRTVARRRLLEDNVRLRDAVKTLEACRTLTTCLDPGELYAVSLDLLLQCLSRWRGVALFHRGGELLSDAVALRGLSEDQARRLRGLLVEKKAVDLDAYREIEVLASGDFHDALFEAEVEVTRVLSVPVRGGETEAGILWLFEDERPFDEGEIERTRIVAGHAELSLRNAERFFRAQERALRDDVTDLHNSRYLLEAVQHEMQRAERYGSALSLVFLDLDRFKLVNDRHGHLVGSRALRQLGQVLGDCVRQVDTLARYGGDEFCILLVDTDLAGARTVAERIRRRVEENVFDGGPRGALRVTASLGVAAYPEHGRTREALLDMADKAMYRAKSLGRNRVCSASELLAGGPPARGTGRRDAPSD